MPKGGNLNLVFSGSSRITFARLAWHERFAPRHRAGGWSFAFCLALHAGHQAAAAEWFALEQALAPARSWSAGSLKKLSVKFARADPRSLNSGV